jgi:hypothetical protein
LGTVDYFSIQNAFEVSLLSWTEFLIEDHNVRVMELHHACEFLDFAGAHQRGGVPCGARLYHALQNPSAGARCQSGELFHRFFSGVERLDRDQRRTCLQFEAYKDSALTVAMLVVLILLTRQSQML